MTSVDTTVHATATPAVASTAGGASTTAPDNGPQQRSLRWRRRKAPTASTNEPRLVPRQVEAVELASNDPLLVYLAAARRPVDVHELTLDSPGVTDMRAAGVRMLVPLVASGRLVGVIQLGDRLSEQEYSGDDRGLLERLASHVAPALRVGQLVREQQAETVVRERYQQELQVAQLIQQQFLPKDLPEPSGWRISPFYRAAREVGGDFYDVLELPDGRLGLVIGDVTDKGVPASLVMASTRSVLRAAAQRLVAPGEVLARVNDELVKDIPAKMFVTCLYGVLDPVTGEFWFANAGHDLPFLDHGDHVTEVRATGMPLGMMPGSEYEEARVTLGAGSRLLLYSDGLAEAHAPDGEMFGFPRVGETLSRLPFGPTLIDRLLDELAAFVGPHWEQEDDITLLAIQRASDVLTFDGSAPLSTRFSLPSVPDGERDAIRLVMEFVDHLDLPAGRRNALETAVGEAVMNAMEHGNRYQSDLDVDVEVVIDPELISVAVTDQGGGTGYLDEAEQPDIMAKLRGDQSPRGWGLFLVRELVDAVQETGDADHHTLILEMHREADRDQ